MIPLQLDRNTLDALSVGVVRWLRHDGQADAVLDYANPAYLALMGLDPQVVGTRFNPAHLIHPDDREAYARVVAGSLNTEVVLTFTLRVRRPDGSVRWVRNRASGIRQGNITWRTSTVEDVTEQVDQQVQLQAANQRLSTIFENSTATLAVFEGREIRWINQGVTDLLGWAPHEMVGQTTRMFFSSDEQWQAVGQRTWAAHSQGRAFDEDLTLQHKDGSVRWVRLSMRVLDPNARPMQAIAVIVDITERKALEAINETLRALLDRSSDYISLADAGGRFLYINKGGLQMLGYQDLGELRGQHVTSTHAAWSKEVDQREVFPALVSQGQWRGELGLRAKDGSDIPVQAEIIRMAGDGTANLVSSGAIMRDLRAQKAYEQELIKSREEAQAANMAKTHFLSTISHEIRTPMNSIIGAFQLLSTRPLDERDRALVETGRQAGGLLLSVIGDVLDFAKIEAGKLELDPQPARLSDTMRHLEGMFTTVPRKEGVDLAFYCDPLLSQAVLVDDMRLRQVLANLISNAVKFTHLGGVYVDALVVQRDEQSMLVEFMVQDTGIGMGPEVLDKLFKPFTQASGGLSRKYGGTGLGLSISERLIRSMGGQLLAESQLGKGSLFTVRIKLPITDTPLHNGGGGDPLASDAVAGEPGMARPDSGEPRDKPKPLMGMRVMVVDDVPTNRFIARALLESLGAAVTLAEDGAGAVSQLRDQGLEVDLVFMEMQMPVMDGLEATRMLRNSGQPRLERLPIVALSGNVSPEDREDAQKAGMTGFVSKPVDLDELLKICQKIKFTPGGDADASAWSYVI